MRKLGRGEAKCLAQGRAVNGYEHADQILLGLTGDRWLDGTPAGTNKGYGSLGLCVGQG